MRGLVFEGHRKIGLLDFPDPKPGPGEVVLEMKASGFCGSDLKFYRGSPAETMKALGVPGDASNYTPVIAGHEPCGVVRELGEGVSRKKFRPGDRVVVFHYSGCNSCNHCRSGWNQLCAEGATIYGANANGGHARYLVVPARTLVHLPEEISFAGGAAIACGTGTAFGALLRLNAMGGSTLAVFGLGPVGLSAVQFANAMGMEVIAVDIAQSRVDWVKEFGATHVINASKQDAVEEIFKITKGRGVKYSIDCSGAPAARRDAVRATSVWGTCVLVGVGGDMTIDVMKELITKQRTIIGSWTFSDVGMEECARFVANHGIDVDKQFTHRWSLDDGVKAYEEFDKQTSGKAVFIFN